jgi:hypothetical protein
MDLNVNIAFIPPKEVLIRAIAISQDVFKSYDSQIKLGLSGNYPHITIYQLVVSSKNFQDLTDSIEDISKKIVPQNFKFLKPEHHDGYIGIEFRRTRKLTAAQAQILKTANKFRERRSIISAEQELLYDPEQRKIIKKFGFENLGRYYRPHVTLAKLDDVHSAKKALEGLDMDVPDFICSQIGIFLLGEFGTCKKLLKKFSLKAGD